MLLPLKTLLVSGVTADHLFLYCSITMGLEQRFILCYVHSYVNHFVGSMTGEECWDLGREKVS